MFSPSKLSVGNSFLFFSLSLRTEEAAKREDNQVALIVGGFSSGVRSIRVECSIVVGVVAKGEIMGQPELLLRINKMQSCVWPPPMKAVGSKRRNFRHFATNKIACFQIQQFDASYWLSVLIWQKQPLHPLIRPPIMPPRVNRIRINRIKVYFKYQILWSKCVLDLSCSGSWIY